MEQVRRISFQMLLLDQDRDPDGIAEQGLAAGHIEKGFVDGEELDKRE